MDYSRFCIYTDLDGTLFNDETKISQRNIDALNEFTSNGGLFAVSTGRMQKNTIPLVKDLPISAPCIFNNGSSSSYLHSNKSLIKCEFNFDLYKADVYSLISIYPDLICQIYTEDEMIYLTDPLLADKEFLRHHSQYVYKKVVEKDLNILKILFTDSTSSIKNKESTIRSLFDDRLFLCYSSVRYLEAVKIGVSKGSMLKQIKDNGLLGDRIIIAAGDYENDITLLKEADIPVCPINACSIIKAISKHILCSNNDGIIKDILDKVIGKL